MDARTIDDAGERLRELRAQEWQDLGLAAVALVLAVAATWALPSLALPLFLGGVGVGFLGLRALWRRWDLLERLSGDRTAYVIPDVRACAAREATMERRRIYAATIRGTLAEPESLGAVAGELEALADELEDEELALEPACAVACMRLVTDPSASPLLRPASSPEELRSSVRRIRSGFAPGR
ncbi:MAG TPA: hypothetical protein VD769_14725 [Gaiellaceae bacterium]|nr:hypothetical protein [Gaiellaceae bacterium]